MPISAAFSKDVTTPHKRILLALQGIILQECCQGPFTIASLGVLEHCDGLQALEAHLDANQSPDLIIACIDDRFGEDMEIVRRLRRKTPASQWILLCQQCGPDFVGQAVSAGVEGFVLEEAPAAVVGLAAELVLRGHSFISKKLAQSHRFGLRSGATLEQATRSALPTPRAGSGNTPRNADRAKSMANAQPPLPTSLAHISEGDDWAGISPAPARSGYASKSSLSDREMQILACLGDGCPNKLIARRLNITEATVKVHVKALLRKMQVANRTQAALSASKFLPRKVQAAAVMTEAS